MRSAIGGTFAGIRACLNQPPTFLTSFMADAGDGGAEGAAEDQEQRGSRKIAIGLGPR